MADEESAAYLPCEHLTSTVLLELAQWNHVPWTEEISQTQTTAHLGGKGQAGGECPRAGQGRRWGGRVPKAAMLPVAAIAETGGLLRSTYRPASYSHSLSDRDSQVLITS